MSSTNVLRIELSPKPGFCIKSTALNPALLPPTASDPSPNILEPAPQPIPVPKGQKIFVNLAWDPNVPPPPDASEEEIKRAMQGEDAVDDANPSGWYVPVIVSNARQDKDKSGNPSLVFDCIFNSTVKSRTLRDPEFKIFLVELSLQRIEAQTGLELSRNIGTPNIASKGKLLPRSVHIPSHMVPALVGAPSPSPSPSTAGVSATPASKSNPLIQELSSSSPTNDRTLISPSSASSAPATMPTTTSGSGPGSTLPGLKGILKKPSSAASSASATPGSASTRLDWSWTKEAPSGRLRIDVRVPGLTPTLISTSTLDIEPNRLVLSIPGHPTLDIDTGLSDAEIVARVAGSYSSSSSSSKNTGKANGRAKASASATALKSPAPTSTSTAIKRDDVNTNTNGNEDENDDTAETEKDKETMRILTLKRQRDFAVDEADAVWEVGSARVVVFL